MHYMIGTGNSLIFKTVNKLVQRILILCTYYIPDMQPLQSTRKLSVLKALKKCLTNTTFYIVITYWWCRFLFILAFAYETVSWWVFLFWRVSRVGEQCFRSAAALRL